MSTEKNTLNSSNAHVQTETKVITIQTDVAARDFITVYNSRQAFLNDTFINRIKAGTRKTLAELKRHRFPPTLMDLRLQFAACLMAGVPDQYVFVMNDEQRYTLQQLKHLVPEWAAIAENALIESDPALADKLMSATQWNAKSAFEVAFANAMNELRDLKKAKQAPVHFSHYQKWIIDPLEKAAEHVKEVSTPRNSLIGYGERISLSEALAIAEKLKDEFLKLVDDLAG
jgi:hypothetical protein